jgi:hypothetical protein
MPTEYVTTRQLATRRRQYEIGDRVVLSALDTDERLHAVASGAVVPARWVGTAAEIARRTDVPGSGVPVYEHDTRVLRIGDGVTAPGSLPVALSGTFAPLASAYDRIWLPEAVWNNGAVGSAARTAAAVASRWPAWMFDATSVENIYWGTSTGNSGGVVWVLEGNPVTGDADDLATGDTTIEGNVFTASAAGVLNIDALGVGSAPGLYHLRLKRDGPNGSDTMAGDAGFLGLLLVKS